MLQELEESKNRNRELEDVNEKLTVEIQNLMQMGVAQQTSKHGLNLSNFDAEIELKKSIFNQMTSSQMVTSTMMKSED